MKKHDCVQEEQINDIQSKVKTIMSRMNDVKDLKAKEDELLKKENKYMHDLLDSKFLVLSEKLEANHAIIFAQNQEMISHQKITNGRVNKAEEHIEEMFGKMDELRPTIDELLGYSNFIRWMKKNPAKTVLIAASILFVISAAVDLIGFKSIIDYIK